MNKEMYWAIGIVLALLLLLFAGLIIENIRAGRKWYMGLKQSWKDLLKAPTYKNRPVEKEDDDHPTHHDQNHDQHTQFGGGDFGGGGGGGSY